jgi:hypothetical protein
MSPHAATPGARRSAGEARQARRSRRAWVHETAVDRTHVERTHKRFDRTRQATHGHLSSPRTARPGLATHQDTLSTRQGTRHALHAPRALSHHVSCPVAHARQHIDLPLFASFYLLTRRTLHAPEGLVAHATAHVAAAPVLDDGRPCRRLYIYISPMNSPPFLHASPAPPCLHLQRDAQEAAPPLITRIQTHATARTRAQTRTHARTNTRAGTHARR